MTDTYTFLSLLPCPILLAIAAILLPSIGSVLRIGAVLMWIQFGVALTTCVSRLAVIAQPARAFHGFRLDGSAAFFTLLTTLVVASALSHAVGFFTREQASEHPPGDRDLRRFYVFAALFYLSMVLVVSADNLGYLWIAVEATTLLSAPLVYYHRSGTALEATWKYLMICSVGIAFAFFGTAIIYAASQQVPGLGVGSLSISELTAHARLLPHGLLRLGFVFTLLGYGTKAGLFPLHNWLPDAHSEAPAPASAILSGALLNCALVALWRIANLMAMAGANSFVRLTLLPMGLLTALIASLFLLKQRDLKRMLAYSSMENVGLMAVAIALGSGAGFALQAVNHSLIKVALFLLAGNLIQQYGTKKIQEIRGAYSSRPLQAVLLMLAGIAVAGAPPFGSFLAEWQILSTAADGRHFTTVVVICIALAIAFIAICTQFSAMVFGDVPAKPVADEAAFTSGLSPVLVPALLVVIGILLGVILAPAIFTLVEAVTR